MQLAVSDEKQERSRKKGSRFQKNVGRNAWRTLHICPSLSIILFIVAHVRASTNISSTFCLKYQAILALEYVHYVSKGSSYKAAIQYGTFLTGNRLGCEEESRVEMERIILYHVSEDIRATMDDVAQAAGRSVCTILNSRVFLSVRHCTPAKVRSNGNLGMLVHPDVNLWAAFSPLIVALNYFSKDLHTRGSIYTIWWEFNFVTTSRES